MPELNQKEAAKLIVIKKVISKDVSQIEAAEMLNLSTRQIRRLIKKFELNGEKAFIHGNKGNQNAKQIPQDTKDNIIDCYLKDYYDYNFTHFYEESGFENILSYGSMFKFFTKVGIISPEAQHKTVKLYNESMKKSIKENKATEEEIQLFEERKKEEEVKHIRRSSNRYSFGEEVQMDAAFDEWFGNVVTALHLAVDKATGKVLYGYFDYQETTRGYFVLLFNIILHYGIPDTIKTDKRTSFSINSKSSSLNKTQFANICERLEIRLISSSDPQFKPNVERENKTVKGRLKGELRRAKITEIKEANKYFVEVFLPKLNNLFSYDINPNKNVIRENIYTKEELNIIISERFNRTMDNANSIKFKNDYYIPINNVTGEIFCCAAKTPCIVIIAFDETLWCWVNDTLCSLKKVEKREQEVISKSTLKPKLTAYKGHKPSPNHPWAYHKKN